LEPLRMGVYRADQRLGGRDESVPAIFPVLMRHTLLVR
jgi:hypothetical protein